MFQCYMNAEKSVSRVEFRKHLFKYFCNGSDRSSTQFSKEGEDIDEIDQFTDLRQLAESWGLI